MRTDSASAGTGSGGSRGHMFSILLILIDSGLLQLHLGERLEQ